MNEIFFKASLSYCLITSFPQIRLVTTSNTDKNPYMADGTFLFYTLKWQIFFSVKHIL